MRIMIIVISVIIVIQIVKTYLVINRIKKNRISITLNCLGVLLSVVLGLILIELISNEQTNIYVFYFSIIYSIFSIINSLLAFISFYNSNSVSNYSIKQAIDLSEVGILVVKNNKVILKNTVISQLLNKMKIKDNFIKQIKEKSINNLKDGYVIIIDNIAWLFYINDTEILAYNIDEEYKLNLKLENQNKEIIENNKKIIYIINNMEYIQNEIQSQKLRNKFHDLLGQNLSILHQYMIQKESKVVNLDDIKFMIEKMFTELEDTNNTKIDLENFIKVHQNAGTQISIIGKMPKDEKKAKVFFEIIREATTNAIKHAGSNKIHVNIIENQKNCKMIITNNGLKPNGTIVEHDGISGMKRKIKELGGEIIIYSTNEYKIEVMV